MARKSLAWQITERDVDVLKVLEELPLTASLLQEWSQRFQMPFPNIDVVHRRLTILRQAAGLVHRWPLAIASRGRSEHYYRLTLKGLRCLHEDDSLTAPTSRAFSPIGEAHHRHCLGLSRLIVHLGVGAHHVAVPFRFVGENRYSFTINGKPYRSDGYLRIGDDDSQRSFLVEIDNSTESIFSDRDADSIERKIRVIEEYQAQFEGNDHRRAITLFVTLRSRERAINILTAVRKLSRNVFRRNFYAAYLPDILCSTLPLTDRLFVDHNEMPVALLPSGTLECFGKRRSKVASNPTLC